MNKPAKADPVIWLHPRPDGKVSMWVWAHFDPDHITKPVMRVVTWSEISLWAAKRAEKMGETKPAPKLAPKPAPIAKDDDALLALKALGYSTSEGKRMLEGATGTTEERVAYALQKA